MRRIFWWALAACISTLATAGASVAAADLTAAQIVEKNAAARGGLEAWRKVQTMVWMGHIESANPASPRLPFVLEQKRPNKTRFEITADNQRSTHVYDGTNGWKLRPTSSGTPEVQPYTDDELKFAQDTQVIDGALIDYAAKGVDVTLGGVDEVDGRRAYRLDVRVLSGLKQSVWIDAQTFLDIRYDRTTRHSLGQSGTVSVFYRNYRAFEGLQIPLSIETASAPGKPPSKLVIDKVVLNPRLADHAFDKPRLPASRRNGVVVDTRSAGASQTVRLAP
jgi:outer membrane lipoprotein-sorting protein